MSNIINWSEIPVTRTDRAIALHEPVMQVSSRRKNTDCAELVVFPYRDPTPDGAPARFDSITPSTQGTVIYLHMDNLVATLERVVTTGGQCVFGPLELGQDIGTVTLFTDSEGGRVDLHQLVQYFRH